MTRQILAVAALCGVLAVACGKVGPPVRVRAQPTATESSETAGQPATSSTDEAKEEEKRP
jgi:hypothetical protein